MNDLFQLDPSRIYLNHGAFGACPSDVLRYQRDLRDEMESDPIEFLAPERSLLPRIDLVRQRIAKEIQAEPSDFVFTRGTTDAVNAVVSSLPVQPGDQWMVTSHVYNACHGALQYHAAKNGVELLVVEIPLFVSSPDQVLAALDAMLNPRVRFLLVEHIASTTSTIMPLAEIITLAHQRSVSVMVDGAHAPGMLPIDMESLDADYYAGNHHKWWCAPKASGFLYVRREYQPVIFPTVISHGFDFKWRRTSDFQSNFDWNGTYDPTALLSVPFCLDAVARMKPGGWPEIQNTCRERLDRALSLLRVAFPKMQVTAPADMRGQMATVMLQPQTATVEQAANLQVILRENYRIEIPVFLLVNPLLSEPVLCIRMSSAVYHQDEDFEQLVNALTKCIPLI